MQQTQISFIKAAPEIALYCHFREIFSTNIKISVLNQDEMGNLGWQKRPVCSHFIYFLHYFLCSSKCSCVGNDSPTNFHFLFLFHVATQWKYKKNRGVLRGDTFNREMWRGERDHSSHRETDCVRKLVVWDELKH